MKVLIANRGEIAIRIMHACQELGFFSIAVYTETDELSRHIRCADEAVALGTGSGYLDGKMMIEVAHSYNAQAIHPGYGFLSENKEFARAVEAAGLVFIGPRPDTIALTGDKLAARLSAQAAGLPVLPGSYQPLKPGVDIRLPVGVDFPLLVKATAGGGGRGIRQVNSQDELQPMIHAARHEALAAFGNDEVYLESLLKNARHIEVQIIGDGKGKVIALGERECSLQRRRQKLIEEAPACRLTHALRRSLQRAAVRLGKALNYRSLGTVEFLLDGKQNYYFIEVNPRIQVEHPVTELVTGIDLVREQLLLAASGNLRLNQSQIKPTGCAIEARVLAEDPENGFLPSTGYIEYLKEPSGAGIRVDSALYQGMPVSANFDSLLAKVIAWDENRNMAIRRLQRALDEFCISGITTDIPFLLHILNHPEYQTGSFDTSFLENITPPESYLSLEDAAIAVVLFAHQRKKTKKNQTSNTLNPWLVSAWSEQMTDKSQEIV